MSDYLEALEKVNQDLSEDQRNYLENQKKNKMSRKEKKDNQSLV